MDVLADILKTIGTEIRVTRVFDHKEPWRFQFVPEEEIAFYLVAEGHCRLSILREPLKSGEVVFVSHGVSHVLEGRNDQPVMIIAGAVTFVSGRQGIQALGFPKFFVLRGLSGSTCEATFRRFVSEAISAKPGWQAATEGLAMSLFIDTLRSHCASTETGSHGWLRGLSDEEIGKSLRMMHERPIHPWTVSELAGLLSISRSTFASRFKAVTGRTPVGYLTWWRLNRAAARLRRRDGSTIAMIARDSGYDSDVSFGKAFRREFGKSPGEVRREASTHVSSPLQYELKKQTPFEVPEQEAGLNLIRTAVQLEAEYQALFQKSGLDELQFNVLRILRGVGAPVTEDEIRNRLLRQNADQRRLFPELIKNKLIRRAAKNRNEFEITPEGNAVLGEIDRPLIDLHRRQLAHFSPGELAELNRLLVKARRPEN